MMLDLIIGKSKDEALRLADIFLRMIQGKASEEEMDELEESSILADVAHMPARVKMCLSRMAYRKGNARKKALAANVRHVMNNRFRFDAPSVADEEELDDQLVAYNLRKVPLQTRGAFC